MKKLICLVLLVLAVFSFSCVGLMESVSSFDESVFTNAGYTTKGDIFSGQKILYMQDKDVVMLDYTTKQNTLGLQIDTNIFGKSAKEEGEMPAWTEGDKSQFHKKQIMTDFYPCIVYDSSHEVPYSFVVALSLPPIGENEWLAVQGPFEVMIATDEHIYTLKRYLSANTSFYHDIIFMTVDEALMEMFYDLSKSEESVIRAVSVDGKTQDIYQYVSAGSKNGKAVGVPIIGYNWAEEVQDVIDAWELYVQAGGTAQDLSSYANAIEVKDR